MGVARTDGSVSFLEYRTLKLHWRVHSRACFGVSSSKRDQACRTLVNEGNASRTLGDSIVALVKIIQYVTELCNLDLDHGYALPKRQRTADGEIEIGFDQPRGKILCQSDKFGTLVSLTPQTLKMACSISNADIATFKIHLSRSYEP